MVENAFPILLADAYTCSRIGLFQVLTDAGFHVVAETGSLDELDALAQSHQPRLLLLAGNLLPDPPLPFLAGLRRRYPAMKIVLFLSDDYDLPWRELVNAGVNGMLLKTESCSVISQTIKAAAAGSAAFSPELLARITEPPHTPAAETKDVPLTMPEQQLLQFLCADKSNLEIAETLNLSRKTVEKRLGMCQGF